MSFQLVRDLSANILDVISDTYEMNDDVDNVKFNKSLFIEY